MWEGFKELTSYWECHNVPIMHGFITTGYRYSWLCHIESQHDRQHYLQDILLSGHSEKTPTLISWKGANSITIKIDNLCDFKFDNKFFITYYLDNSKVISGDGGEKDRGWIMMENIGGS